MKSFGKYFGYHLKTSVWRGAAFAVALVVWTMNTVRIRNIVTEKDAFGNWIRIPAAETGDLIFYLLGLGLLVAIFEIYMLKNRRNLDTYYSFPISRWKMALAHWLCGVIHLFVISALCFLVSGFILSSLEGAKLGYLIPYWALSFLSMTAVYSVFSFFLIKMNTVFDGVAIFVGFIFAMEYCFEFLGDVFDNPSLIKWQALREAYGFIYDIINDAVDGYAYLDRFDDLITNNVRVEMFYDYANIALIWGIVGAASVFGILFTANRVKTHKVGGVSDSWFGYKTFIPLIVIAFLLATETNFYSMNSGFVSDFGKINFAYLFIPLAMFIAYVVYRRGFKLRLSDIIWVSAITVVVVALMIYPDFLTRIAVLLINPWYEPPVMICGTAFVN